MNKLLFILLLSSLLISCERITTADEAQISPIKIGVILPLTGDWASWGQRIQQGLELSKEYLKHSIEFEFEDEGVCEPKKGVQAARRLLSERIDILIIGCVATTRAFLKESKQHDVLIFSAGLLDSESFNQGAMVVNFATQVGTQAIYQAKYIEQQEYRSVAIVRPQEPFGEELANILKRALEDRKIKVLFDDSDSYSTNDFGSVVVKIIRDKPDLVVINLGEAQELAFIKKLRESGSTVPILSTDGLESNNTSQHNLKMLEGITYTYPFSSALEDPTKLNFDRDFSNKYGTETKPNANVYFVHDGLTLLDNAFTKCGTSNTKCIFSYFTALGKVAGLSGDVTFKENGSTDRPYRIKRVVGGKFIWLN